MTLPRQIAIRADASATIGVGHIMRCLVLADELARCGIVTTFLCCEITDWALAQLRDHGHDWIKLTPDDASQAADAQATIAACRSLEAGLVLVDHYALKSAWCHDIVAAEFRLCAIDDLAETSRPVEVLIDPGLGRNPIDYAELVPPSAVCLTGADYGFLRPEFALLRDGPSLKSDGVQHVVVSMGGSDPAGHTQVCLDALDGISNIRITVVLTSGAPHLTAVQSRVEAMHTATTLLVDHGDMATLLASADLALGAGGGSALERCALGVPSLLSVQAENQRVNAEHLAAVGAVEIVAVATLRNQIEAVLADPNRLQAMAAAAAKLCDGRGGARVALEIIKLYSGTRLRPVQPDDMRLVFDWQCAPGVRDFSRTPEPPKWEEHQSWFARRMERTGTDPFYIIQDGPNPVGFVRLDQSDARTFEVSILLAPDAQGKGIARIALAHLRLTHPKRTIVASVHPSNVPSQRLFQKAGYERMKKDAFISVGWDADRKLSKKDQNAD